MKSRSRRRDEKRALTARVFIVAFLLVVATFATRHSALAVDGDELLASGQSYCQNGDYANAIATLESFVTQFPNATNRNKGELYLGCSYLLRSVSDVVVNKTDTATARPHFAHILNQGSAAAYYRDALFHNARSYFLENDYATAKTKLLQFLAEYPKDDFLQYVYYYLGVCETNVGTLDQALAYYDRSETEYPNSPLKWFCKLEKATILGRKGQYSLSDQLLTLVANDPATPPGVVGQATIQRALLMLVQNKPQDSVALLESYIQRYKNVDDALATVQDAYLYEAYAYFAMKEYQRALNLLDEVERLGSTLPVEAASVKIKLFLALNRVADAESLLNLLANSSYGRANPDFITTYRAMLDLAKGNRDQVVTSLTTLLGPVAQSQGSSVVNFTYAPGPPRLEPLHFVEACGFLTIAYAGRYGASRNQSDAVAQEALYQATARYVATLNDPSISMVLSAIDRGRQAVMKNAAAQQSSFSVIAPDSIYSGVPYGGDGFSPASTNAQGLGTIPSRQESPQTQAPNQSPTASNQAGYPTYAPTNNGLQLPHGTDPNAQLGTTATDVNPTAAPNTVGEAPAPTTPEPESIPVTAAEVRKAIELATNFYSNLEFDRANEILLETRMKSLTFWDDCPAEAARLSLLRANALLELGKRSEAQMTCQELVEHEPNTQEAAVAYYYLGAMADSVGRRDEAIANLRLATSGRGDFPYADAALYCLGTNELERGDVASATQTFGRLYRHYPSSPYWSHTVWRLAKIEADLRNDAPAEKLVNEALARRPDSAIVDYLLFLKGEIALRAKDYDKALIAFDMIVEQYPDSVWRSRAKNRLAAIPERFVRSVESRGAATTQERAQEQREASADPTAKGSANNDDDAPLDAPKRGLPQETRPEPSTRVPSHSELRSRAAQNLRPGGATSSSTDAASQNSRGTSRPTNSTTNQKSPSSTL